MLEQVLSQPVLARGEVQVRVLVTEGLHLGLLELREGEGKGGGGKRGRERKGRRERRGGDRRWEGMRKGEEREGKEKGE